MPKTTRLSISPENLPYLESLAQNWGLDNSSKALNYLLFDLKCHGHPTAGGSTPFVQIPSCELYRESMLIATQQIQQLPQEEQGPDEVIQKFLAIGLDSF